MAESPPPMDFEEEQATEEPAKVEEELEEEAPKAKPQETTPAELPLDSEPPPMDSEESAVPEPAPMAPPPTLETREADSEEEEEEVVEKSKPVEPLKTLDLFEDEPPAEATPQETKDDPEQEEEEEEEEDEDEEEDDSFELEISVSEPEKVGDGMGAYIAYNVTTKTTIPSFKSPECSVRRRFSDFLGLHSKMSEKYMSKGRIVPPAPEKSAMGTTKIKFSKSEENNAAFLERRRASLQRYLNRLAKHPGLRKDEDFRNFLENPSELPKATDTGVFSTAGLMRLVKNVGDSISKITGKRGDPDGWFDEQQQNYEVLEMHLKKLHQAIETMTACRKDLCTSTGAFVKSVATLGNVEENDTVSRALSRLSEVEEKVETLHQEQHQHDLFIFGETVKDYISLLGSIRLSFHERVKLYNTWQSAQSTLAKKRETEVKLQTGGKPEKIEQIKHEIKDWEEKVEEGQKAFDRASKMLKKEVQRFETERSQEFKEKFIAYFESLMNMQQELIRVWEGYLPDAQAIA